MLIPFELILYIVFLGLYATEAGGRASPAAWASLAVVALFAVAAGALARLAALAVLRRIDRLEAGRHDYDAPFAPNGSWRSALGSLAAKAARLWIVLAAGFALTASRLPFILRSAAASAEAEAVAGRDFFQAAVPLLLGLLPFLAAYFAVWVGLYPLFARLGPTDGLAAFLAHQARYGLYFLLFWIPLMLLGVWVEGHAWASWLAWPLTLLAVWAFPALLARVWRCRPLPPGAVTELVADLERRAGRRFSRIFVWPLGGSRVANAAAAGLLPPFRYLFLSRALVENLPPDELAAVVGHELGHVRHRHQLSFLLIGLGTLTALLALVEWLPTESTLERLLLTGLALAFFFRIGYGALSRGFERQADLFAAKLTGGPDALARALERIAIMGGQPRSAPSWHHYGIAERVAFLRAADADPGLARRHELRTTRRRTIGVGLSLALLGLLAAEAWRESADGPGTPSLSSSGAAAMTVSSPAAESALADARRDAALRHWRRLAALFPDDPKGPLEAARLLNGGDVNGDGGRPPTPAERDAARRWVGEALRRSPPPRRNGGIPPPSSHDDLHPLLDV